VQQHFRALTGTSRLQYQRQLRLQEARQLMLGQHPDAGSAASRVGYESASQFSCEYGRLFGARPEDVKHLRRARWAEKACPQGPSRTDATAHTRPCGQRPCERARPGARRV